MMLWIVLIGGLASQRVTDQSWFIKAFTKSCHSAGIVGRFKLSHFLSEFVWSDFYLGPVFNDFWYAVTAGNCDEGNDGG